jgi:hypothetical protein
VAGRAAPALHAPSASSAAYRGPASPRAPRRLGVRRRALVVALAAAFTLLLGVGAPLADAYGDTHGGLAALDHLLERGHR